MREMSKNTHESIRILEKTLEVNNSSVVFTDPEGNIVHVNPAFTEHTGYTLQDVRGKKPSILKSGHQSDEVYRDLWQTISSGATWSGQMQNKKKDGSLFWEQATIFPIFGDDKKVSLYVGIKEDITQTIRQDLMLRCIGEANQTLVRASNLDLAIPEILRSLGEACEVERSYLFEYQESTSSSSKEQISLQCEWNSGKFQPQINNPEMQGLQAGSGILQEWIQELRAGRVVQENVSALPEEIRLLMEKQSIVSLLLVPVHISEKLYGFIGFDACRGGRNWNDQEIHLLRSVAGNLGIVLQRKTFERDIQDALLKAENSALEAIKADSAKSAFLATMSHEIRTPLNGILGLAQVLLEDQFTADQRDLVETIYSSGLNLSSLLNDILDFSKIEAGKLEIVTRDFSLYPVVDEVIKLFESPARTAGTELKCVYSPEIPKYITGDPDRIRQILLNLVSNSVKFTEKGKIEVHVHLTSEDRPCIEFRIEDTGIGIDPAYREHMFDTFSQADNTSTRRYGGTGLGLAICKRLVLAMKGSITCENRANGGTRFTVKIPHISSSPQESRPKVETERNGNLIENSPSPIRILVVEDNPINQRVTHLQLKSIGHTCEIVDSGQEAIELFRQKQIFDFIFMDCQMPDLNGFETTKEILQISNPPPYIVALTASASKQDRERAKEVGMQGYLLKPVRKEDLENAIAASFTNQNGSTNFSTCKEGNLEPQLSNPRHLSSAGRAVDL